MPFDSSLSLQATASSLYTRRIFTHRNSNNAEKVRSSCFNIQSVVPRSWVFKLGFKIRFETARNEFHSDASRGTSRIVRPRKWRRFEYFKVSGSFFFFNIVKYVWRLKYGAIRTVWCNFFIVRKKKEKKVSKRKRLGEIGANFAKRCTILLSISNIQEINKIHQLTKLSFQNLKLGAIFSDVLWTSDRFQMLLAI